MNDVTLTYNCVGLDLIGNVACLVFPAIMILDSLIIYLHFPALFAYISKLLILYAVVLLQPVPYFEYFYFYKFIEYVWYIPFSSFNGNSCLV